MKNIAVVCHDNVSPLTGAGGVRTLKIAQGFGKKGYNVIIIAPSKEKRIDNLDVYSVYSLHNKNNIFINLLKFNISVFSRLIKNIRKTDFIVVHNAISLPAVIILAAMFRKKVFVEVTDIHSEYVKMRSKILYFSFIAAIASLFEHKLISCADKIIAVTHQMKQHLQTNGINGNKIYVVYDGVNQEQFFKQKNKGNHNKIVHLGLVNPHSGVECLIKSFVYVLKEAADTTLYIIGDGLEKEKCIAWANELKIKKSVFFREFINHDLMGETLKDFSIGVIPRPDTKGNNLVITLKLLEYWASATAVVASRLKGIEEVTRDNYNILFALPGDPKDLAAKILLLLKDKNMAQRLSVEGLTSVKSFSWDNTVNQTINICLDNNYAK